MSLTDTKEKWIVIKHFIFRPVTNSRSVIFQCSTESIASGAIRQKCNIREKSLIVNQKYYYWFSSKGKYALIESIYYCVALLYIAWVPELLLHLGTKATKKNLHVMQLCVCMYACIMHLLKIRTTTFYCCFAYLVISLFKNWRYNASRHGYLNPPSLFALQNGDAVH